MMRRTKRRGRGAGIEVSSWSSWQGIPCADFGPGARRQILARKFAIIYAKGIKYLEAKLNMFFFFFFVS